MQDQCPDQAQDQLEVPIYDSLAVCGAERPSGLGRAPLLAQCPPLPRPAPEVLLERWVRTYSFSDYQILHPVRPGP